ncbi:MULTISPECIES: PTS glucitol/sorbitol transporter subunit IIB [Niallia]|jgi:glucitol/sorbitol PTS system EIIB component|uniref:PTS glucitol/sorbitol transporter subunit IIB n=1 Tax=Niallia TaxID=2837506 RepID=UPI0002E119C3|nr:PTS glucitol/sorbitol transporter subunit IIB [Niallia circulans]NRG29395.1 PTS glucitol/sorbitol transporter subunit IIB [Niallia circulans]QJX60428.1 PTS glucitol/sorbitol transporter subunit IIB [Niallia circulans]
MEKGKIIKVDKGGSGWGGPLYLECQGKKNKVLSMTGGGIHDLAAYIADAINGEAIDGFKDVPNDDEIVCVIINCGGTLRCGVYPQKGIYTINLNAIGPSGPLAQHIVKEIYVSGVKKENISYVKESDQRENNHVNPITSEPKEQPAKVSKASQEEVKSNPIFNLLSKIGAGVGYVVSMFLDSGRKTVDLLLKTIIPFMAFVSILVALVQYTGVGEGIANILSPLGSSLWGLLVISIICSFPFLSPLLGPGAAVAQVVGVLVGTQIAAGAIPPQFALPALFAINAQVGGDFFPVGMSLMQAKPKTIQYGTPAFLIARQISSPISVVVAYLISIGLYS